MTNAAVNVDDILIPREKALSNNAQAPVQSVEHAIQHEEPAYVANEEPVSNSAQEEPAASSEQEAAETPAQEAPANEPEAQDTSNPIDEYGNPVAKPKTYTEEEVQRMIRDRLSRGRHAEQPNPQQTSQEAKDFKADPNSEEPWEAQLEAFVEKTIEKRQQKLSEQQWKQQEAQKQADFEVRFTSGMNKYDDFHQVVGNQPITDGMMMAARNLENPAAFIYGAAKLHPQEIERISRISDPYAQAAEVGRLHERMVKHRNVASKASKPLEAPKGDIPAKQSTRPPIDYLISQHAKQKQGNRR